MAGFFVSRNEFITHTLETALKIHRVLQGERNDVALSAVLAIAGSTAEKFANLDPDSTPANVLLLIALIREVSDDIADYAVAPRTRES